MCYNLLHYAVTYCRESSTPGTFSAALPFFMAIGCSVCQTKTKKIQWVAACGRKRAVSCSVCGVGLAQDIWVPLNRNKNDKYKQIKVDCQVRTSIHCAGSVERRVGGVRIVCDDMCVRVCVFIHCCKHVCMHVFTNVCTWIHRYIDTVINTRWHSESDTATLPHSFSSRIHTICSYV